MANATAAEAASQLTLEVASKGKTSLDREITRRSVEVMKSRLKSVGIDGAVEQRGDRGIVVRVAHSGSELDWIVTMLTRPSRLEFRMVNDEGSADAPAADEEVLSEARMGADGKVEELPYVLKKKAALAGDIVDHAEAAIDEFQRPIIHLDLNGKGTMLLAKVTRDFIGKRLAVVIDGNVISAPVIQSEIPGGKLQITGNFTMDEAGDLANAIKSGYLPSAIKVADRRESAPAVEAIASNEENVDDIPTLQVPPQPNNVAVVIGIESYRDIKGVEFASRDAASVRQYLTKLMGYREENVVFLPNERATKSDMEKYLGAWLKNRVTPQSTVFVYYAGHGAPNPTSGEPYLLPYDGDPNYLETTAYPLKDLYAGLGRLPAKQVVVVLDACFSGSGGRSVIAQGARPLVMVTDTPTVFKGNMVVLAAAGGSQISTSDEKAGHGLFTYYLLKGLKGGADQGKTGAVTVEQLYRYLRPEVERAARLQNVEQTPVILPGLAALKEMGQLRLR